METRVPISHTRQSYSLFRRSSGVLSTLGPTDGATSARRILLNMSSLVLRRSPYGLGNLYVSLLPFTPIIFIFLLTLLQKDDPDLDRNCLIPPNCLSLDKLRECASRHIIRKSTIKPEPVPIHVHINNNPFSASHAANEPLPGLKRTHSVASISSNDSQDGESLPLSIILADLHLKFPKLNLPQYEAVLEEHGIVYGDCVADFDRNFYISLGMAQGAVGPFLKGVRKAVNQEKRDRKYAKFGDKENGYNRAESVEI